MRYPPTLQYGLSNTIIELYSILSSPSTVSLHQNMRQVQHTPTSAL
ncbi:putative MscS family protein [Venturia inaequalis]|nr:putative MscS family protein [Venturia inaequalis]